MIILRILAWVLIAMALMVLGYDAISTLDEGVPVITTAAELLGLMGLELTVPESGVGKFFLDLPVEALLGVPGLILALIFRPVD